MISFFKFAFITYQALALNGRGSGHFVDHNEMKKDKFWNAPECISWFFDFQRPLWPQLELISSENWDVITCWLRHLFKGIIILVAANYISNDYKPVSIIPIFLMIFEKLIHSRLQYYLHCKNLLRIITLIFVQIKLFPMKFITSFVRFSNHSIIKNPQ